MGNILDKRADGAPPAGVDTLKVLTDHFRKNHVNICTMLCTDDHNGRTRLRSTLTIFCEEGRYKVCLNDRENAQVAFCEGVDLMKVLLGMESGLDDDSLVWRATKGLNSGGRYQPTH